MTGVDARAARTATNAMATGNAVRGATDTMIAQQSIPSLSGIYAMDSVGLGQFNRFAEVLARLANQRGPITGNNASSDPLRDRPHAVDHRRRSEKDDRSPEQSGPARTRESGRDSSRQSSESVIGDPIRASRRTSHGVDGEAKRDQQELDSNAATAVAASPVIDADVTTADHAIAQTVNGTERASATAASDASKGQADGQRHSAVFPGDTVETTGDNGDLADGQRAPNEGLQDDHSRASRTREGEAEQRSESARSNAREASAAQKVRVNSQHTSPNSVEPMHASPESSAVPPSHSSGSPLLMGASQPNTNAVLAADAAMKTAAAIQGSKPGGRQAASTGESQHSNRSTVPALSTSHLASSTDATGATGSSAKTRETRHEIIARVKLVQRVSKAFQHLGSEGGSIRLRLAPAELGSVRVEMQVRDFRVRARVVAETEAATHALREHLPDLRSRLESQGMQLDSIEVETAAADGDSDSYHDGMSRWHSREDQRRSPSSFTASSETLREDIEARNPVDVDPSGAHQGVDLRA